MMSPMSPLAGGPVRGLAGLARRCRDGPVLPRSTAEPQQAAPAAACRQLPGRGARAVPGCDISVVIA